MNFFTRGIRNTFRNLIRTFSIVFILGLSIGLALIMLIAKSAVDQKITQVKSKIGNTISIRPAGINGFEGGGNLLTTQQLASVSKLPNVTSLTEILSDRLTSSDTNLQSSITAGSFGHRQANINFQSQGGSQGGGGFGGFGGGGFNPANFTPPVVVTGVNNSNSIASAISASSINLTSGNNIDASGSSDIAIVGSSLASKNNLKVGSTFTAYSTTFKVVGIYDGGNTFANSGLVMPLQTVQTLSQQANQVSSAIATINSVDNLDSATTAISNDLGSSADVVNSQTQSTQTIAPLQSVSKLSVICLIGAVISASIIILLTMVMIVRERRREIGVYKAIGASNATVMSQFASEAVGFTLLAAIVGIIIGVIGSNPITTLLVDNASNTSSTTPGGFGGGFGRRLLSGSQQNIRQIHAAVGWDILIYGLIVSLVIAIIGSVIASFLIAKIRPAEVMRVE
jgi:putative ABC transport system permease protein